MPISRYWLLIFLGCVLYAQQSWVDGFFFDGYLYATLGKNAALGGHWLVPHYTEATYSRFFHHPPFIFALEGIFFKIFGVSNTAMRLFTGGFALATLALLVYWIAQDDHIKQRKKWWSWFAGIAFLLIPPLIKKTRFVNLDIPLMFFMTTSLFFYWRAYSGRYTNFLLSGFFFGCSLLTKGPISLLIPTIAATHLWCIIGIRGFANIYLWMGMVLGFFVFSLWPLLLYATENFDIFLNYYNFTFVYTIGKGREKESLDVFFYITFLLTNCGPWFLAALFSTWHGIRQNKADRDPLLFLFICSFWIPLIVFSLFRHKYSHYLIPSYPALAALAGFCALSLLRKKWKPKILDGFKILSPLVALILLIFPLTTNVHRDRAIHKIVDILDYLDKKPKHWAIVDNAYPFFHAAGVLAWRDSTPVYALSSKAITYDSMGSKKWPLLLVPLSLWRKWQEADRGKILTNWKALAIVPKKNFVVLLEKHLWDKKTPPLEIK